MTIAMTDTNKTASARKTWVVLAAHGSTRRPEANETVTKHARRLGESGLFRGASAAFLLGDAGPADIAGDIDAEKVVIVPYMMSDGYLTGEISARIEAALKDRGNGGQVRITDPVGTHRDIAVIARDTACHALAHAGYEAGKATLVLVAHGSGGRPESKACALAHAKTLIESRDFGDVRLATLEEAPFLEDVLSEVDGPAAVVGLFAAPGGHAVDDVARAIAARGLATIIDAGPVGTTAAMTDIVLARAMAALKP